MLSSVASPLAALGNHRILVISVQLTLAEVFDNMYGWGPEHGVSLPPNLTRESIGK